MTDRLRANGREFVAFGSALQVDGVPVLQSTHEFRVRPLPVSIRDLLQGLRVGMGESTHLLEEVFEPSWSDEFDNDDRLIRGVPQGMHDAARLEQESTFVHLHLLLANEPADPTSIDERELVLPFVTVRDHEFSRSEDSRLRRESSTRVIGRDHVPEDGSGDRWAVVPGDGTSRHDLHPDFRGRGRS